MKTLRNLVRLGAGEFGLETNLNPRKPHVRVKNLKIHYDKTAKSFVGIEAHRKTSRSASASSRRSRIVPTWSCSPRPPRTSKAGCPNSGRFCQPRSFWCTQDPGRWRIGLGRGSPFGGGRGCPRPAQAGQVGLDRRLAYKRRRARLSDRHLLSYRLKLEKGSPRHWRGSTRRAVFLKFSAWGGFGCQVQLPSLCREGTNISLRKLCSPLWSTACQTPLAICLSPTILDMPSSVCSNAPSTALRWLIGPCSVRANLSPSGSRSATWRASWTSAAPVSPAARRARALPPICVYRGWLEPAFFSLLGREQNNINAELENQEFLEAVCKCPGWE